MGGEKEIFLEKLKHIPLSLIEIRIDIYVFRDLNTMFFSLQRSATQFTWRRREELTFKMIKYMDLENLDISRVIQPNTN